MIPETKPRGIHFLGVVKLKDEYRYRALVASISAVVPSGNGLLLLHLGYLLQPRNSPDIP